MQAMRDMFLGKIVCVFPGDCMGLQAEVLDINEQGAMFKITVEREKEYKYRVGDIFFIAYASGLRFKLAKNINAMTINTMDIA